MKALSIIFFILTPLLLIFILYTYIKIYSNLKKIIIKNRTQFKEKEMQKILEDLNKELPLIIDKKQNNISNKHEVLHK